jgi:fibronectin type 3 domain-containing protein
MTVTSTAFANDKITYTISFKPNQKKIVGVDLKIAYDSSLLKVDNCATIESGMVEKGNSYDDKNMYSIVFIDTSGLNVGTSSKEFAKITFSALSKRGKSNIKIYCSEYLSDDGNNNNDVRKSNSLNTLYSSSLDTTIPLAKPQKRILQMRPTSIFFTWNKVPGATKYLVYRKVNNAKTWTYLTTTTAITYSDTNVKSGNTYTYTVKAYDGKKYSSYDTTGWSIKFLSVPKLTKVENTYSGPRIYWEKVTGATSYIVYRKTGSGSWTKLATTRDVKYIDKTAKTNTNYKYTVKAACSSSTTSYNTTGLGILCINPPKISKLTKSSAGITLQWSKITGAKGYYVYRKAGNATTWTRIATTTSTKYVDKNVKSGITYTYTLKAYNGSTYSGYNGNGWKIKR